MPRAERPSAPSDELTARRNWRGPTLANGVLTADLAEFCQSGVSLVIASRGLDGGPIAGRALACRIDAPGNVRLLLRRTANAALLEALGRGAGFAVTFTQPTTHRSIQLKASAARVASPSVADGMAAASQRARFRDEIIAVGHSVAFATVYCASEPHELAAVDFVPEHAFVQTPGPGAGSALRA